MEVRWTTAMLDVPGAVHEAEVTFWGRATASDLSARRGDADEFATFVPVEVDVDPFLRLQVIDLGPRVHLDLHVGSAEGSRGGGLLRALTEALALGATVRHDAGTHVVLASPGGFVFCLVRDEGEAARPSAVDGVLVDQLCLDVPAAVFEREVAFWVGLTGWEAPTLASGADLVPLRRPGHLPLRLLLQRLGQDPRERVTAHLDLASADRAAAVATHEAWGARVVGSGARWTTLVDPAGLAYCLTDRDPGTGFLPGA
ncbi:hypothetical protein C8046_10530 [Serinibacter arcticus]|uniref:Glyoxalase-like domain-containing protein n=1 Tax=Serinibacter arcticus TaxID=1655435 RepID=A0A2U1ZVL9_9MICO|nr:VOC family protein [Serinibacter arcticus]PWD51019.1 hypothetical protein C8046_10530 [Serinibacter arcticus]